MISSREFISPSLHMTYQLHPLIYIAFALNSFLYHCIIIIILSISYQLGHQSTLALFGAEVLRVADYLQTNVFPDLVIVEREEYLYALQRKAIGGAMSKVVKETAGKTWPGLTLETSTSASTIHHTTRWVGVTAEFLLISNGLDNKA